MKLEDSFEKEELSMFKKIKIVFALCTASMILLGTTAFASNGSLSYSHGTGSDYLLGRVWSTKVESSLGVKLTINYSDGTNHTTGGTVGRKSVKDYTLEYYPGQKAGEFSAKYYCGGSYVKSSAAPWKFDFK